MEKLKVNQSDITEKNVNYLTWVIVLSLSSYFLWDGWLIILSLFLGTLAIGVIKCLCDGTAQRVIKRKALLTQLRDEKTELLSQEQWELINELIINKDH